MRTFIILIFLFSSSFSQENPRWKNPALKNKNAAVSIAFVPQFPHEIAGFQLGVYTASGIGAFVQGNWGQKQHSVKESEVTHVSVEAQRQYFNGARWELLGKNKYPHEQDHDSFKAGLFAPLHENIHLIAGVSMAKYKDNFYVKNDATFWSSAMNSHAYDVVIDDPTFVRNEDGDHTKFGAVAGMAYLFGNGITIQAAYVSEPNGLMFGIGNISLF